MSATIFCYLSLTCIYRKGLFAPEDRHHDVTSSTPLEGGGIESLAQHALVID